jgi:hypothetical protein
VLAEVGNYGFLGTEFIESPPEFGSVETTSFANDRSEAFGQLARLRWQINSDEFLLGERLVDAIVLLRRQEQTFPSSHSSSSVEPYPLVSIQPLDDDEGGRLFPWRAVIETDEPDYYLARLEPIAEWLGIGVDLVPYRQLRLLKQCIEPGGMEGVVGGLVEDTERFAMTCNHVLAPTCGSAAVRGKPYDDPSLPKNEPDAALVRLDTQCLEVPSGRRRRSYIVASDQILLDCAQKKTKVFKRNPRARQNSGFVYNVTLMIPRTDAGPPYRCPNVEIKPYQNSYIFGALKLPLFNGHFSQPGESGSWVEHNEMGIWFGMVVSGMPDGSTHAVLGDYLLDYFRQKLMEMRGAAASTDLVPFTLS